MTATEDRRRREIRRLRDDIATLRTIIDARLDADGGRDRTVLLAQAKLLRDKKERLEELERIE
jgi:hypothetical protein